MAIEMREIFDEAEAARLAFLEDSRGLSADDEPEMDPKRAARIERAVLQLPQLPTDALPAFAGRGACAGQGDLFLVELFDDDGSRRPKKDIEAATRMAQAICGTCIIHPTCAEFVDGKYKWMPNADHFAVVAGKVYAQAHPARR